MDWVFPSSGFNPNRPVVMILTGLGPTVHWHKAGGFVADAVWHLSERQGCTVVVLVSRGTMDTEVQKGLFHGARVADIHDALGATHKALQVCEKPPPVFGFGYSMGGIMLANYCGTYGKDARLAGGVSFGGVYDTNVNHLFEYSRLVWQVYLVYPMKTWIFRGRHAEQARSRGVAVEKIQSSACPALSDFDREMQVVYHGYGTLHAYYDAVGVAGYDRWKKVAVPLLAVNARDDPICHCDALRVEEFAAGNKNLMFLITERGGHIGWPLGWRPWRHGWDFMHEVAQHFLDAYAPQ